jgi:hypothetical protein
MQQIPADIWATLERRLDHKVSEVVMFSSGQPDFFYAPHNQAASTVLNMTFSLALRFVLCITAKQNLLLLRSNSAAISLTA